MILTGKEIKDLAEYAGFIVTVEDEDQLEHEYTIIDCPACGITDYDGKVYHFHKAVICDGCDPGEVSPLGNSIERLSA